MERYRNGGTLVPSGTSLKDEGGGLLSGETSSGEGHLLWLHCRTKGSSPGASIGTVKINRSEMRNPLHCPRCGARLTRIRESLSSSTIACYSIVPFSVGGVHGRAAEIPASVRSSSPGDAQTERDPSKPFARQCALGNRERHDGSLGLRAGRHFTCPWSTQERGPCPWIRFDRAPSKLSAATLLLQFR